MPQKTKGKAQCSPLAELAKEQLKKLDRKLVAKIVEAYNTPMKDGDRLIIVDRLYRERNQIEADLRKYES